MKPKANLGDRFYRLGPDHRGGQDIDFVVLRRRFDFRSIEVGQWVTKAESAKAAGWFYDALCDLMHIITGPESLISLRGTLSFRYGMGGRPGISAHYSPESRSFALAKNAGPGSVAHEWFHALDHYLADKAFRGVSPGVFASSAWLNDTPLIPHPLNNRLVDCFRAVLLDETGTQPSTLVRTSATIDKSLGITYYSRPEEICARAFEAFVQDAPIKNKFLVKGTKASEEAQVGLYPTGEERERMNAAWRAYFQALGGRLRVEAERSQVPP
jgi:hypothetical protein